MDGEAGEAEFWTPEHGSVIVGSVDAELLVPHESRAIRNDWMISSIFTIQSGIVQITFPPD